MKTIFILSAISILSLCLYCTFRNRNESDNISPKPIISFVDPHRHESVRIEEKPSILVSQANEGTVRKSVQMFIDTKNESRLSHALLSMIGKAENSAEWKGISTVLSDETEALEVRQEAAQFLLRFDPHRTAQLLKDIFSHTKSNMFKSYIIQYLSDLPEHGTEQFLLTCLENGSVLEKREALLALIRRGSEQGIKLLGVLLKDDSQESLALRDLVIRCIQDLDLREYIALIRENALNTDETIRIAAIVALANWRDVDSRELFKEANNSAHTRLKRAGAFALRKLGSLEGPDEIDPSR